MKKLRKLHLYVGLFFTLPLILIALTGVVLVFRNNSQWLKPNTQASFSFQHDQLLAPQILIQKLTNVDGSQIKSINYNFKKGTANIRAAEDYEYTVNAATGEILVEGKSNTGIFFKIHEGDFFGEWYKWFITTSAGIGLVVLCITGTLIYINIQKRRRHSHSK